MVRRKSAFSDTFGQRFILLYPTLKGSNPVRAPLSDIMAGSARWQYGLLRDIGAHVPMIHGRGSFNSVQVLDRRFSYSHTDLFVLLTAQLPKPTVKFSLSHQLA